LELNEGWVTLLQQRLAKEYPCYHVINESISGDTTSNGLARFPKEIKSYSPDVVIIEYGGNDGLRGLSLSAMKNNLAQMINLAQQRDSKVLLLGVKLPPNYGVQYATAFQQIYLDLGEQFHISVVDKLLDDIGVKPELMQDDGIHPNAKAQPLLLNKVWQMLTPMLLCQ